MVLPRFNNIKASGVITKPTKNLLSPCSDRDHNHSDDTHDYGAPKSRNDLHSCNIRSVRNMATESYERRDSSEADDGFKVAELRQS